MEKKKAKITEKRKAQRIYLPLNLEYIPKHDPQNPIKIELKNISGRGIAAVLPRKFDKNDRVDLLIYLPEKSEPIKASCMVVWNKEIDKEKFLTGFKIFRADDYHGLIQFLCDKILELSLEEG